MNLLFKTFLVLLIPVASFASSIRARCAATNGQKTFLTYDITRAKASAGALASCRKFFGRACKPAGCTDFSAAQAAAIARGGAYVSKTKKGGVVKSRPAPSTSSDDDGAVEGAYGAIRRNQEYEQQKLLDQLAREHRGLLSAPILPAWSDDAVELSNGQVCGPTADAGTVYCK